MDIYYQNSNGGVNSASNRNEYQEFPGGKRQPAGGADNLTAICKPTVLKMCSLDLSQSYGPSWPVTGIAFTESKREYSG
jgi:hypothetical protein